VLSHAELARLAGAAYRGPWSGRVALDCKYDLLPRDGEVVVVMPGTDPADPLDWLRDLDARPRCFPEIGVCHAGFGAGATMIAGKVAPALAGERRLLTVAGHSLGGALALALGALLIARGYRVRVVTFGAPRVAFFCNFALCRLAREAGELAEYRRAGDPVPAVPPRPFYKPVTRGIALGVALPDPPGVVGEIAGKIGNHDIRLYASDLAAREAA
jgi:hypothetical protein